jgi:hypothetical protein
MKSTRSPNRCCVDATALSFLAAVLLLGSSCAPMDKPIEPAEVLSDRDDEILEPAEDCTGTEQLLGEKDLMIEHLNELLEASQRQLEEAIQEVVRAKAKQRSVESRAEAAAQLAEAEIALETYRGKLDGRHSSQLAQAEQRLERGNREFEVRNFGGALYLAIQTKGHIRDGMRSLENPRNAEALGGETPFAPPLAFTVRTTSNLRKGPGQEFDVIDTLDTGTTVTGYGSKGKWVRVKRTDGTEGWVHQRLLDAG